MSLLKLVCVLSLVFVLVSAAAPQTRMPCGSGQWRDIFGQCQRFTITATGGAGPGLQPFAPCGNGNWRNINGKCEKFTIAETRTRRAFQRLPCGSGQWRDIFGQCQRFTISAVAGPETGAVASPGLRPYQPCGKGNWRNVNGQCQRFTIGAPTQEVNGGS